MTGDVTPTAENEETAAIPIVAIGASAGGLEQIKLLLKHMPVDTGAAFVVIQHLDPHGESHLTELLAQAGDLPVVTIEDEMTPQADRVHILPAGQRLGMDKHGRLRLGTSQARKARPTLIDGFFRELAAARGPSAVGIILSGTGSDGALGLKAIRGAGGLAMAQHPDDAEFDGMPCAAAQYATPDCLLATSDMVASLCNYLRVSLANDEPATTRADASDDSIDDEALTAILETLREHDKFDFRHHKPAMLKRRLRRRMALSGAASVQTYLATLQKDAEKRHRLCADFLISVTDFFREPESYRALDELVVRKLLHNRNVDNPVRVWVPGCATGEEAYSIAMLLSEAIEASGRNYQFIVFATDIDDSSLPAARAGVFPDSIETDLTAERLRMFFDKVDTHYQVKRSLREHLVFAPQSVTDDLPYSRLDLISCRNLLIYLTSETQQRLITLFHFALKDTGYLFLGSSETIGKQIDLFEPLSKEHRLYRRLATNRQYRVDVSSPSGTRAEPPAGIYRHDSSRPRHIEQIARDILLAEHVPASVLINRNLEILCSYGPTREYLALPLGESSLALMDMVHNEYRSYLRAVTHRAFRDNEKSDITVPLQERNDHALLITARPLHQPEQARGLMLITFERVPGAGARRLEASSQGDLEQQLAEELDATRNELNSTIAALEESNEDLKGSNEEIMSMNEELQSTNEELETSQEELHSVNDELTAANTELESKIAELESAQNELNNLFAGSQVAMLFLDRALHITRFTPAIRNLMNLISADIGRPLRDMTLRFDDPDLLADADRVLDDLAAREAEVQCTDGRWYQRRILPYRTRDDVINGVVITFADITGLRHAVLAAQEHETRLDLAVSALSGGMWEVQIDPDAPDGLLDDIYLSARLKNLMGFDDKQMANTLEAWTELVLPEDRAHFRDFARRRQSETGQPLYYRIRHRDGQLRWFAGYGRLVTDMYGNATRWLGIDCDVTDAKMADIRGRNAQAQLRLLADALPELVAFVDPQEIVRFANTAFNEWFGTDADAAATRNVATVLGPATSAELAPCGDKALAGTTTSHDVVIANEAHGERTCHAHHIPHFADGKVQGYFLLLIDSAAAGQPATDESDEQTRLVYIQRMAMIGEMASTLAHDLKQPLSAITSYAGALTRMLHAGKPADQTAAVVQKIADQIERTGSIVDGVRGLVGRAGSGDSILKLNDLLNDAVELSSGRFRKHNVDVRVALSTPLPAINGDKAQIQQILINLFNNAVDAMDDTDSDNRTLWLATEAPDTGQVQVTVTDSGPGIPPGKLESVFQSFSSTKLEGMGMGLAISRSIARWHGGDLWAESQPDHGATFHLTLPVAKAGS